MCKITKKVGIFYAVSGKKLGYCPNNFPFKALERMFKPLERTFQPLECKFKPLERKIVPIENTFPSKSRDFFP